MRHSLAACAVETAHRLIATPASRPHATTRRTVGRVLLGAEVLGMIRQPKGNRTPGTQGLEVQLGVYDRHSRRVLDDNVDLVSGEFSLTLGGWESACIVTTSILRRSESGWMPAAFEFPDPTAPRHLHRLILAERADPTDRAFAEELTNGRRLRDNDLLLIARRLRWRLSVDHAEPNSPPNILYWTTPTTDEWLRRWVEARDRSEERPEDWRKMLALLGPRVAGQPCRCDDAPNNPDDWGDVQVEDDPLTVVTLGPSSDRAATHADVEHTLRRAAPQLTVVSRQLAERESRYPIADYAKALFDIADEEDLLERIDILLLYRGGGIQDLAQPRAVDDGKRPVARSTDKQQLLDAVTRLASCGVEVVVGIGHGDQSMFPDNATLPIGVFEALTPTAAAEWVLAEHVNTRLAGSGIRQPSRYRRSVRRR